MLNAKALWIQDLDNDAEKALTLKQIAATGANHVCVRTSSSLLKDLIQNFHDQGIRVFGWRWTNVVTTSDRTHKYVKDEADYVAQTLIPAGLDGYVFDVESDDDGSAHDWDRKDVPNLMQLAQYYTGTIRDAAVKTRRPFLLGLTSHARGFTNYPGIPWQPFLDVSAVLFPQTYWRFYKDKTKSGVDENKGTPDSAIKIGYADYPKTKPIVPVAGELQCATVDEIKQFGALLADRKVIDGHFYVSNASIKDDVLAAIKAL